MEWLSWESFNLSIDDRGVRPGKRLQKSVLVLETTRKPGGRRAQEIRAIGGGGFPYNSKERNTRGGNVKEWVIDLRGQSRLPRRTRKNQEGAV